MEELSIDSIRVSLSNYQRVVILKLKSKEMFIPMNLFQNNNDYTRRNTNNINTT